MAEIDGVLGRPNRASLVGPRERFQTLPEATRAALRRIDLDLDGVTEMDWLANVGKQTPHDAVRAWMRVNEGRVPDWLKT